MTIEILLISGLNMLGLPIQLMMTSFVTLIRYIGSLMLKSYILIVLGYHMQLFHPIYKHKSAMQIDPKQNI